MKKQIQSDANFKDTYKIGTRYRTGIYRHILCVDKVRILMIYYF